MIPSSAHWTTFMWFVSSSVEIGIIFGFFLGEVKVKIEVVLKYDFKSFFEWKK